MTNHLANNIRYLRKRNGWSQEQLAERLQIKRSSIAAYESKNVRPRLDLVLAMSKLFKVSISDLIEKDLAKAEWREERSENESEHEGGVIESVENQSFGVHDPEDLKLFIEKSAGIRKMLEGFKAFYLLKLENIGNLNEDTRRLAGDIENFLLLMEHLLTFNEAVIRMVSKERQLPDAQ